MKRRFQTDQITPNDGYSIDSALLLNQNTKNLLFDKLSAHWFGKPDLEAYFCCRLSRENQWSLEFTQRAVAEYKKFLYLGAITSEIVSPSRIVDQVWHLHLLFSEPYWDGLCKDVLNKSFHHKPNTEKDDETFLKAYQKTLALYKNEFGDNPPEDIWPKNILTGNFVWVDLNTFILVPRRMIFIFGYIILALYGVGKLFKL